MDSFLDHLARAVSARQSFFAEPHQQAFRLFNGFLEGCPGLTLDVYGSTLVIFNLSRDPALLESAITDSVNFLPSHLPWLRTGLLKTRHTAHAVQKRGTLLFGTTVDQKIREHGVWYAFSLVLGQDAGFFLDTRNLRQWAITHLKAKTVLNTFAYTGSLGAAALAAGASRVVQMDRNREFLSLAQKTYSLNTFPPPGADFIIGDFWEEVVHLKHTAQRFDCIFLDPPFFSSTSRTNLDLNTDSVRLINKLRPLVADGGWLVAVNNALYLSGQAYLSSLESICKDGYLEISELIPVPDDVCPPPSSRQAPLPADPTPFNHSTKIAILKVRRKNP